jgi:hypothetical protein
MAGIAGDSTQGWWYPYSELQKFRNRENVNENQHGGRSYL